MTFTESVKTCLFRKYAVFRGRAARSEYWWFTLFGWIFGELPLQFTGALSEDDLVVIASQIPITVLWGIIIIPFILALTLLLPGLAVTCRRLHDIGRSGWWSLVILLSLLISLVGPMSSFERDFKMIAAVPMVVLLIFLLRKGTSGNNRFGPSPDKEFA